MAVRKMADGFERIVEILIDEAAKTLARIEAKVEEKIPEPEKPLPGWVNRKRIAEHLGVSERTVGSWIAKRRIPYVRMSRRILFKVEDVDEHLKRYGFGGMF